MARAHRHDDIEVNVALGGPLVYVLGGQVVVLPAGCTALYWAAVPHQLVEVEHGATVHWLTVPMGTVLGFGLPERSLAGLLRGEPAVLSGTDPEGLPPDWVDLTSDEPELRAAALLEVEAWLRRRTWAVGRAGTAGQVGPVDPAGRAMPRNVAAATAMARDIAVSFRESVTVGQVAERAHLSAGHAMTIFRQVVGTTMGSYLSQCRVAEAQRLLITTDATTAQVGARSGFASQSAFYEAFRTVSGQSPAAYRRSVGRGGP